MIYTSKNSPVLIGLALVLATVAPAFAGTIHATGNDSSLYTIDPVTGAFARVGAVGANTTQMLDVAQHGGKMFGVTFASTFFAIDSETGQGTQVGSLGAFVNALEFGSNGRLYGAGGNSFFSIDPLTGAATQVGPAGPYNSSGDLAFLNGTLFLSSSTRSVGTDQLYRINPVTGVSTALPNAIGFPMVFGLAAGNGVLYGISNSPTAGRSAIIAINPGTGIGTLVSYLGGSAPGARASSAASAFDGIYGFSLYGATTVPAPDTVPEPATFALLGLGLAAMAGLSLRRRP